MNSDYKQSTYKVENRCYAIEGGVLMRSKSEVIIGNKLESFKIPYRYEEVITLSGKPIAPAFIIKNPFTGETFIWEHFGALHLENYENSMNEKMNLFHRVGFVSQGQVIYSFEADIRNINFVVATIKNKILK